MRIRQLNCPLREGLCLSALANLEGGDEGVEERVLERVEEAWHTVGCREEGANQSSDGQKRQR